MPGFGSRNSSVSAGLRPASSALSFSLRSGASTTAFQAACASGFTGVAVCGAGDGAVLQATRESSNRTMRFIGIAPGLVCGRLRLAERGPDRYNGRMFSVTQELPFCYGHRLLQYPGKCGRLHGHNGLARITLRSRELDRQGMVADFDQIERSMRRYLDESFDHRLLLHREDPLVPVLRAAGEDFVAIEV